VPIAVRILYIPQKRIDERRGFPYDVRRNVTARFDSRVEPRSVKSAQKRNGVRLQKRLAAGERDSARIAVKRRVAKTQPDYIRYAHTPARYLQSRSGAESFAHAAGGTPAPVDIVNAVIKRMHAVFTRRADAAADAFFIIK
jgi:hypothetical protein